MLTVRGGSPQATSATYVKQAPALYVLLGVSGKIMIMRGYARSAFDIIVWLLEICTKGVRTRKYRKGRIYGS